MTRLSSRPASSFGALAYRALGGWGLRVVDYSLIFMLQYKSCAYGTPKLWFPLLMVTPFACCTGSSFVAFAIIFNT